MDANTEAGEDGYPTTSALRLRSLPRETGDFVKVTDKEPGGDERIAEVRKHLGRYFSRFVALSESGGCIRCNWPLGGITGSFTWGLAHGEGTCGRCGWPARAVHRIVMSDLGELSIRRLILQYHPDEVGT